MKFEKKTHFWEACFETRQITNWKEKFYFLFFHMRSLNRLSTFWHYLYRQRGKCVPLCFPSVIPRTAKFVFTHWNFQFSRFQYTNLVKIRYLPKMRRRNYTNNMQSENSFSSSSKRNALPSSPYRDSTIFAVSTPHGRAALAIIRISGPRATDVSGLSLSPSLYFRFWSLCKSTTFS